MNLTGPIRRFAFLSIASAAVAAAATAPDPASGTADQFFGLDKIYTFTLNITAADYTRMQPKGISMPKPGVTGDDRYPVVEAVLEFEGRRWGPLNIRYKGNSSYRPRQLKRSFKLEFEGPRGAKDKSRRFFGMSKLNLNNNASDFSQMRESLGYDIFRRAGVPAPRTAYARVFLTVTGMPGMYPREYAGIYTVVEQVDQTFLKDRFGAKSGLLLKPEGIEGTQYFGEDWKKYVLPYGAKSPDQIDPDSARRFIDFVRFLKNASRSDFAERIGQFLDVDEFLHFCAVENVIANLDSALTDKNHNYYLTLNPNTHKVVWLPWDLNLAFGTYRGGSLQKLSIGKLTPLAGRILGVPEYRQKYEAIIRAIVDDNFTASRLNDEMDRISALIRSAVNGDSATSLQLFDWSLSPNPGPAPAIPLPPGSPASASVGLIGMTEPPLRRFIALRGESVTRQIASRATQQSVN